MWEVERTSGQCVVSGRALVEGEEFFGVLFEEGEGFRRADYSIDVWAGPPEDAFCFFKTRVPVKQKRKRLLVDNEMLLGFFLRLAEEAEPVRIHFRFVLALILMRKRLLRYDGSATTDGVETWDMTLTAESSKHRVVNPRLTDDEVTAVSAQLTAILHGDMGHWTEPEDATSEPKPETSTKGAANADGEADGIADADADAGTSTNTAAAKDDGVAGADNENSSTPEDAKDTEEAKDAQDAVANDTNANSQVGS